MVFFVNKGCYSVFTLNMIVNSFSDILFLELFVFQPHLYGSGKPVLLFSV